MYRHVWPGSRRKNIDFRGIVRPVLEHYVRRRSGSSPEHGDKEDFASPLLAAILNTLAYILKAYNRCHRQRFCPSFSIRWSTTRLISRTGDGKELCTKIISTMKTTGQGNNSYYLRNKQREFDFFYSCRYDKSIRSIYIKKKNLHFAAPFKRLATFYQVYRKLCTFKDQSKDNFKRE